MSAILVRKQFYTVREFARALSVHPNTIYRYVRSDELPHRHVGNKVLIPVKALEQFCNGTLKLK